MRQNKKPWNTNWYSTTESIPILRFVPTLALSKSGKVEGTTPSSQPAVASSLEFVVVLLSCAHHRSVEAYWPPLTPEHGFPSLLSDQGAPLRLPRRCAKRDHFLSKQKTGDNLSDASCKKSLNMTSYGGIIRIRLKGRSSVTSSQPVNTSSPVFICKYIIYLFFRNCNTHTKNPLRDSSCWIRSSSFSDGAAMVW